MLQPFIPGKETLTLSFLVAFWCEQELEEMKKRLKEMEEEAAALRDMQAKVEKEMTAYNTGNQNIQSLSLSLPLSLSLAPSLAPSLARIEP